MGRLLNKILEDKGLVLSIIIGAAYRLKIFFNKKVFFGKGLKIIGGIILDIRGDAFLRIADKVLFRSRNRGYHGQLSSKVKIMIDTGGVVDIGSETRVYGACIHASKSIQIGSRCLIASNVQIFDRNGHSAEFSQPENRINTFGDAKSVVIGDDVWIGTNSVILPGTEIGNGCIVMANSVVKGQFPSKSLIGGVPAIVLKSQ